MFKMLDVANQYGTFMVLWNVVDGYSVYKTDLDNMTARRLGTAYTDLHQFLQIGVHCTMQAQRVWDSQAVPPLTSL